jgi:hypothetical protein
LKNGKNFWMQELNTSEIKQRPENYKYLTSVTNRFRIKLDINVKLDLGSLVPYLKMSDSHFVLIDAHLKSVLVTLIRIWKFNWTQLKSFQFLIIFTVKPNQE